MKRFLLSFAFVAALAVGASSCGTPYENIEVKYECTMAFHGSLTKAYTDEAQEQIDALLLEVAADFAKFGRVFTYVGSGSTMQEIAEAADAYIAPAQAGSRVNAKELYAKWQERFASLDIKGAITLYKVTYTFECIQGGGTAFDVINFDDLTYSYTLPEEK